MTVAVTGATGTVGWFIVERLIAAGESVRAWRRPSSWIDAFPSGIDWIDGDLASPESAGRLVAGADALVHAALDHVPGRFRGGEGTDLARYLATNVGGSLALLAAARDAGVERVIVLSSRAVFGALASGPLADDAPVAPDTHYGASKVALEAFARSFAAEGWPVAALRPTGIYGVMAPAERSKWFSLVQRALAGEPVDARAATEVHGADVAGAVVRLLAADAAEIAGRAFNCSDLVVQTRDIVAVAHRIAGMRGPLPDAAPPPSGIMACDGLAALGVRFGGTPLFEATVEELVDAVRGGGGARP